MTSLLTFKKQPPNEQGIPAWRVFLGANCIGTAMNPGPSVAGMSWAGVAPDGTRFGATSRPKLAQKLQIHAAMQRSVR